MSTVANEPVTSDLDAQSIVPVKPAPKDGIVPPQTAAPWYEWPFFNWIVPLFEQGQQRTDADEPLELSDLFSIPTHEDPKYNEQRIQVFWQAELAKSRADPEYKPDLASVLWQVYKWRLFVGGLYRFVSDAATFAQPFLLREFTKWLQSPAQDTYIGWMWLIGIVGCNVVMSISLNFSQQHTQTAFTQMQNGLRILIFDSTLRYPSNHDDAGKVTSAATVDMMQLVTLAPLIHGCVVSPIIVLASIGSLYLFAGYSSFIVFGIMIFTVPVQGCVMAKLFSFRMPFQEAGNRRVNILTELLQGVRIMKQMVWESNFAQRIFEARERELEWYNVMLAWRVPLMLLIIAMPQITNFALFALQYEFEGDVLAYKTMPALTVLNSIRIPLFFIPLAYSKLFDVKTSMQRVAEVCAAHYNRHIYVTRVPRHNDDIAIEMKNVTIVGDAQHAEKKKKASLMTAMMMQKQNGNGSPQSPPVPSRQSPTSPPDQQQQQQQQQQEMTTVPANGGTNSLNENSKAQIIAKNLSLTIPRGKLTIIVGSTGSGKSQLLNALLGEADVLNDGGHVDVYGSDIALISQQAWIMNATARENIVMGEPFDEALYNQVVEACQLVPDFRVLPGNDQAELGSKGISISGGQKARVSIARALYSKREIVVADDPLSACDPGVSNAIFDSCFSNDGLSKGRTRVLVTHQAHLVPKADKVVVMKNCAIIFDGSVEELRGSGLYEVLEAEELQEQESRRAAEDAAAAAVAAAKTKKAVVATTTDATTSSSSMPSNQQIIELDAQKKKNLEEQEKEKKGRLTVKEIDQAGSVTLETYSWYGDLGGKGLFFLCFLFASLSSGCFVMSNIFLALWSSKQSLGVIPAYTNDQYLWIMGSFAAAGSFFLIFRQTFFSDFSSNVALNIHDAMARNILRAPTTWFDQNPISRVLNRLSKDLSAVDFGIFENLQMTINMLFGVVAAVATVCISAPYVLVITPFLVAYLYKVFTFYANTVRGLKRLEGSSNSPYLGLLGEALSGLASIRAFGTGEILKVDNENRVLVSSIPAYNSKQAMRRLSAQTDNVGSVILFVVTGLGALSRSVDTSSWLGLNPALVALAISSALTSTNSITMLTRTLAEFETSFTAVERVREYTISIPQERVYDYELEGNLPAPGPAWPARGAIEFQNFSLRYRPDLPLVLNDVSFTIEAGTRVGLVGRTGSGKSTTTLALLRMIERASGKILIDGRDIETVDLPDLRSVFTSLPQEATLFSGTVRSNLDPFAQHSDESLWKAIDQLGLRDRLTTFIKSDGEPTGLDARVAGGGGSNFSVGERQLLCLARAILKKSKILLADEATASVDKDADALIQKVLRTDFPGVTTIIIAHRLATIIDCDRIIVLDKGRVVESDTPINLLSKPAGDANSVFRGMCEKLGTQQFEVLRQIASGEKTYAEALQLHTEIEGEGGDHTK